MPSFVFVGPDAVPIACAGRVVRAKLRPCELGQGQDSVATQWQEVEGWRRWCCETSLVLVGPDGIRCQDAMVLALVLEPGLRFGLPRLPATRACWCAVVGPQTRNTA